MNRYEIAAHTLLNEHRITVRKWRKNTTGVAYGTKREIEAPVPRGAISFATLAHEVGHVLLHADNGNYPRWREEVEAWDFALHAFARFNLPGYVPAMRDATKCVRYAFNKAIRRGVSPDLIRETYPVWYGTVYET